MRSTVERELKLDLDPAFALPELPGEPIEGRVFTSTYHDTPDRSLGRAGITLRRRVENGSSLWQLKLPRADDARMELEEAGGPTGPPEALARLLAAHLRHGGLEPVATLRTRRSGVRVVDGERRIAEVTVDEVEVIEDGKHAGGFAELEVELVDAGEPADLERLGTLLLRSGARRSSGAPKLMRVLELPAQGTLAKHASLSEHVRSFLVAQLNEIEAHDPGVRLGEDAENVHRFRVATRRTRALIRATRPLYGRALRPLGTELRWLAGLLGPVRDLDVLIAHLRDEIDTLDVDAPDGAEIVRALGEQREQSRRALVEAMSSPRYATLLDLFVRSIALLPPLAADATAATIAEAELRKLRKAARELPKGPSDAELHRLRIEAKRARYAAELALLGGANGAERVVDSAKRLQDAIGEHQDAVVAEERLRAFAAGPGAVAAGRLIERERARRARMRSAYPAALEAALHAGRKAFD
jgi:CHAD domain-containing protein